MAETVDTQMVIYGIGRALDGLEAAADELGTLDAAVGDGDLGVTVRLGCAAVRKALPGLAGQDIGGVVSRCGMAFNASAPSTTGAFMAIAAMRAGKEAKGAAALDVSLLARMLRAAEAGIVEKGKARRGDKTLLDALGPGVDALEEAAGQGKGLAEAAHLGLEAARRGAASTTAMAAKSGRAAWIAERTVGHQDPGATLVVRLWDAFVGAVGPA